MTKPALYLIFFIVVYFTGYSQQSHDLLRNDDTTIVCQLIATDSTFDFINIDRAGVRYYYGVFHLKIGLINVVDSTIGDTIIVAYVYNMRTERDQYLRRFNLESKHNYIFDLGVFHPCNSDFPRLQGRCVSGFFYPSSKELIRSYSTIYRIVNINRWNGKVEPSSIHIALSN